MIPQVVGGGFNEPVRNSVKPFFFCSCWTARTQRGGVIPPPIGRNRHWGGGAAERAGQHGRVAPESREERTQTKKRERGRPKLRCILGCVAGVLHSAEERCVAVCGAVCGEALSRCCSLLSE